MCTIARVGTHFVLGCALTVMFCDLAAAQEPPNGDFEDGVLDPWFGSGDFGVSEDNVLNGQFSAFVTTSPDAIGEVCSHLLSPSVFPPSDRASARVRFKVRYKTNEATGPLAFYEDPFHVQFVTPKGALDLLTIKTDGIFWTKGSPTNTRVRDGKTGKDLKAPPQIPPFEAGAFEFETPPLSSHSTVKLRGCEPVHIKFQICDWFDTVVDSAAYIDDVRFDFKRGGDKCAEEVLDQDVMQNFIEGPPASRE